MMSGLEDDSIEIKFTKKEVSMLIDLLTWSPIYLVPPNANVPTQRAYQEFKTFLTLIRNKLEALYLLTLD